MHDSIVDGVEIFVPASFGDTLPVSPSSQPYSYDPETVDGLRRILQPGMTALDLGCNVGVMAILMRRLVGSMGSVHGFDGNRDILARARVLAEANGCNDIQWHHALVGETVAAAAEFLIVPGAHGATSTRNAAIQHRHEAVRRCSVPITTLDAFCKTHRVRPHCVKVDVEGGECAVLRGATEVLQTTRPEWVIETHGHEIGSVLGSLEELVTILERAHYVLVDLCTGATVSRQEFVRDYGSHIATVLATPQ